MSYVVFTFPVDGEADAAVVAALLEPHLLDRDGSWGLLLLADGSLEVTGLDDLSTGFAAQHLEGPGSLELLVEVARAADLVVLPLDGPAVVCRPDLLDRLQEDLREGAVVVTDGAGLMEVIRSS